ncbi:MAG: hypothetical protein GY719_23070 [bacterium]|nr:hypothetical protein [bacterium]
MSLLGTHLTLMLGPVVPVPAPPTLLEALDKVEVTHSDSERSGFQLTFRAGRGQLGIADYPVLMDPLLAPGVRVVVMVTFGVVPRVLVDGLITHQQLSPGENPGEGTLAVTGEDLTVVMDRNEKVVEHPAQTESVIALKILATYAHYGIVPQVIPPPAFEVPVPTDRVPVQRGTDLAYLQELAERFGYVFYLEPGPAPAMSLAYWGPPNRTGLPQPALSVNLGSSTNVTTIDFKNDAAAVSSVEGSIQDRQTNVTIPVKSLPSLRPPLAAVPALFNPILAGKKAYRGGGGKSATQAMAEAQGQSEATTDVVQVDGELDAGRYGHVLQSRGLVGLRGAGFTYDGLYYVKTVGHAIARGSYTQSFSLVREGTGANVPVVPV